jgi:hypothetical protein
MCVDKWWDSEVAGPAGISRHWHKYLITANKVKRPPVA